MMREILAKFVVYKVWVEAQGFGYRGFEVTMKLVSIRTQPFSRHWLIVG